MKHVVMFSSGAGSWKTAQRVRDRYGLEDLVLLFSDVKGNHTEEHSGEDADRILALLSYLLTRGGGERADRDFVEGASQTGS